MWVKSQSWATPPPTLSQPRVKIHTDPRRTWAYRFAARRLLCGSARLLGDRLPNEFSYLDHKVRAVARWAVGSADLADADAHNVIETAVAVVVAEVSN